VDAPRALALEGGPAVADAQLRLEALDFGRQNISRFARDGTFDNGVAVAIQGREGSPCEVVGATSARPFARRNRAQGRTS